MQVNAAVSRQWSDGEAVLRQVMGGRLASVGRGDRPRDERADHEQPTSMP